MRMNLSPGLEDKSKVLFPEQHPGGLPANFFQVDVNNHQVCPFLIRVILHKLQVHHWLRTLAHISHEREKKGSKVVVFYAFEKLCVTVYYKCS